MTLLWWLESLLLLLILPVILINDAEWLRYEEKSNCATLLPPISANQHISSSTGLSTVASQARGSGFDRHLSSFFLLTFCLCFSFFLIAFACPMHAHTCTSTTTIFHMFGTHVRIHNVLPDTSTYIITHKTAPTLHTRTRVHAHTHTHTHTHSIMCWDISVNGLVGIEKTHARAAYIHTTTTTITTQCKLQCTPMCLCTSVNRLVSKENTPSVQVAGDDHHECKLCVCASWW